MADLGDLADFMDNVAAGDAQAQLANAYAIAVADAILVDLSYETPADTGLAISNWQVTLDAPALSLVPAFAPSPKGHTRKGLWEHKVPPTLTQLANAPLTLDAGRIVLRAKQPGHPIFITNNLEYIQELNSGTSLQSPAGFVERAEILAAQIVQQRSVVIP